MANTMTAERAAEIRQKTADTYASGGMTEGEKFMENRGDFKPHIFRHGEWFSQKFIIEDGYMVNAYPPKGARDCPVKIIWADGVRCDVTILVKEGRNEEEKWAIALERGRELASTLRKVGDPLAIDIAAQKAQTTRKAKL